MLNKLKQSFFICSFSHCCTMKFKSTLKYIFPFKNIVFFKDYLKATKIVSLKSNKQTNCQFKLFLCWIFIKGFHCFCLGILPFSNHERIFQYDYITFLFNDSNVNFIVFLLVMMLIYIFQIFFTQPSHLNNRLLNEIVIKHDNSFFIYQHNCSNVIYCCALKRYFLTIFNVIQSFKLLFGKFSVV